MRLALTHKMLRILISALNDGRLITQITIEFELDTTSGKLNLGCHWAVQVLGRMEILLVLYESI